MKMFKRFTVLLLLVTLILPNVTMFEVHAAGLDWDGTVAGQYEDGDGTESDPYQIADGAQLARMARRVNNGDETDKHYQLISSIFLNGSKVR